MTKKIIIKALLLVALFAYVACTKPDPDEIPGINIERLLASNSSSTDLLYAVVLHNNNTVTYNNEALFRFDSSVHWHSSYWTYDSRYIFNMMANSEEKELLQITQLNNYCGYPLDCYTGLLIYNLHDTTSLSIGPYPRDYPGTTIKEERFDDKAHTLHITYSFDFSDEIVSMMQKDTSMLRIFPEHYGQ